MAIARTPSEPRQAVPVSPDSGILRLLCGRRSVWTEWRERRAYRRHLQRLLRTGPHLIADIGLTLEAARQEADKPFWRA